MYSVWVQYLLYIHYYYIYLFNVDRSKSSTIKILVAIRLKDKHDMQRWYPNLGEIFRGLFWSENGGNYSPRQCLKLVWIMIENLNLASKYTIICSFRKYTFQYKGPLNFTDASIFLQKISVLWPKWFYRLCVRNPASGLLRIERKLKK